MSGTLQVYGIRWPTCSALQPWRTLFYGVGVICLLVFCALIAAQICS